MDFYIDIKVTEVEPLRIFSARNMGGAASFEERYAVLYRKAFQNRLQVVGAPVAIYHDNHFDGQISDFEVGLPVNGKADGVKEIPGGPHCKAVHNGPHSSLPATYAVMAMWIAENGYRICGAPYDVYIRGGNDKILPPAQYVTEVYIPVTKDEPIEEFDFGDLDVESLLGPPPEEAK